MLHGRFLIRVFSSINKILRMMITLQRKLRKNTEDPNFISKTCSRRVSIRDKLLVKEIQEMETMLPSTCSIKFKDPHKLHDFHLSVTPDEGFWQGGKFWFHVYITEDYNIAPPTVKCQTKLWHPNISEEGDICLSLLRQNSIDGLGWAPTRRLKDVVWGLNSLFTDLLNFEDPLNISAAELYIHDKEAFKNKVRDYVIQYSRSF